VTTAELLTDGSALRQARRLLYVVVVLQLVACGAVGLLAGKYGFTAPIAVVSIATTTCAGYTFAALRWLSRAG